MRQGFLRVYPGSVSVDGTPFEEEAELAGVYIELGRDEDLNCEMVQFEADNGPTVIVEAGRVTRFVRDSKPGDMIETIINGVPSVGTVYTATYYQDLLPGKLRVSGLGGQIMHIHGDNKCRLIVNLAV